MDIMQNNKNQKPMLSTGYNTQYQTPRHNPEEDWRPMTANLLYSKKPYPKPKAEWNQSTATWRNTSKSQSFTREKRFRSSIPYSLDMFELNLTLPISNKASSFGSGKKEPISEITLQNAREIPASNLYQVENIIENTRGPHRGHKFVQGREKYEKVYLSHRKDVYSPHFTKNYPSSIYTVRQPAGMYARATSIYTRNKIFTEEMADLKKGVPGPQYKPDDRRLYSTVHLNNNFNFTKGRRLDLSAPANENPGASQYIIPRFCDKSIEKKEKGKK